MKYANSYGRIFSKNTGIRIFVILNYIFDIFTSWCGDAYLKGLPISDSSYPIDLVSPVSRDINSTSQKKRPGKKVKFTLGHLYCLALVTTETFTIVSQ